MATDTKTTATPNSIAQTAGGNGGTTPPPARTISPTPKATAPAANSGAAPAASTTPADTTPKVAEPESVPVAANAGTAPAAGSGAVQEPADQDAMLPKPGPTTQPPAQVAAPVVTDPTGAPVATPATATGQAQGKTMRTVANVKIEGPQAAAEAKAAGEAVVMMNFPWKVVLTVTHRKQITYHPGPNEVPESLADHPYLQANKVTRFVQPGAGSYPNAATGGLDIEAMRKLVADHDAKAK